MICKRLTGLPGDTIIYPSLDSHGYECITLDDDEVWLDGDNFIGSHDSKYIGPVSAKSLQGKVIHKFSLSPFFTNLLMRKIEFGLLFARSTKEEERREEGDEELDAELDTEFDDKFFDELTDIMLINPLKCFNITRVAKLTPFEWYFLKMVLTDDDSTRGLSSDEREEVTDMVDYALSFFISDVTDEDDKTHDKDIENYEDEDEDEGGGAGESAGPV